VTGQSKLNWRQL